MVQPMSNSPFDFAGRISERDKEIASRFIGSLYRPPDLVIAPAGHGEYLFRWYVAPHNEDANVYFHIQTASDPERPLHDHPWDCTSFILAGGYEEIIDTEPELTDKFSGRDFNPTPSISRCARKVGDVIHRPATWAHRLILPSDVPYSMSLFSTGPKVRDWGFWTKRGFVTWKEITIETEGGSTWNKEALK